MDIRMICLDLDGTALQNDHKTFSPRLVSTLEAAKAKGIRIVPVTGRQYGLLPDALIPMPAWASCVVVCNGGQARSVPSGEVLYRLDIPSSELRKLLALSEQFALPLEFSVDSRLHLTQKSWDRQIGDPSLSFHLSTILPKCGVVVDSLAPVCEMPVEKVNLLCVTPDKREAVEAALNGIDVSAVWSSATNMEITHREASKGVAVQKLCQLFDLSPAQTMALGDSGNDASMLRAAGLGVAMGNAPDSIKAIADAVTLRNDEDGAAIAIETYCL